MPNLSPKNRIRSQWPLPNAKGWRLGLLGFLPAFALLPALIAASSETPVPAVATWGTLEETGVLHVIWILPVPAGEVDTPSARVWVDDLLVAKDGNVIRLGPEGPDALTWVISRASLANDGAIQGHRLGIRFETEEVPGRKPAALGVPETRIASGPIPAVICLDCSEADQRAVEQLLGEGARSERHGLHPTQTNILEVTDARVFPNPFHPFHEDATIAFSISQDAEVEITAFDGNGEFTDTVYQGSLPAGAHQVPWGGQTEDGRKLGNGVYLLRIVAETGARQESQVLKAVVWNE